MDNRSRTKEPPVARYAGPCLFAVASLVLAAFPLVPQLFGPGKGKDYPLWFDVGQWVFQGRDLYNEGFRFLYTPFAAVILAGFSYFGRTAMVVLLTIVNIISWWIAIKASDRLAAENRPVSWWVPIIPSLLSIFFIYDIFLLGQPNLMLLALMLCGFCLLQVSQNSLAGALFAAATAIKAFPIAIVPYLVFRRHWYALASMIAFTLVFLLLVPAPFRGFHRNVEELQVWFQGMVLSHDENRFGQRPERNWGWKNQSLYAVTHRLTRPVHYKTEGSSEEPIFINLIDLGYKGADFVYLCVAIIIGFSFIWLMPANQHRTPRSDAAELAILICLLLIGSPVAYIYFFVWLLFPLTVLVYCAASTAERTVRWQTWILIGAAMTLFAVGVNSHYLQVAGNSLWAAVLIVVGLVWHMRLDSSPSPRARPIS
jgi:hypothetical protein